MLSKMTKVKSSKIISLIVALVLAFSSISLSVYAVTDSEKAEYNKKIEEIREQIAENKKKIQALRDEAATYDDEIGGYQDKIDVLQSQIDLYNQEIALIDAEIKVVEDEITGIENNGTYYGDTEFGVTESYLDTVTLDGEIITLTDGKYTITADDKEHTIITTDKATNSNAIITVKVIAISSLDDAIEELTTSNVKSSDKEAMLVEAKAATSWIYEYIKLISRS